MTTSKKTKTILLVLLAVTALVAGIYLATRAQVPENTLAVEYGGKTHYADLQGLRLTEIHGERVNGKGETKPVDGMGFSLYDLLAWTLGEDFTCETVTATAADGFSAEVSAAELQEDNKAVLLLDEENGSLQLIVFGDSDSKRSVKDIERLTVK